MKEEFVRSADKSETSHVDSEATILNLIRENNRREAEIDELRAALDNAEDLRQNCTRVVAENERLKAALKPFADAVYNDNGDITVDHSGIGIGVFTKAYFVMRRADGNADKGQASAND